MTGVRQGGVAPAWSVRQTPCLGRLAGGSSLQTQRHTPMGSGRKGSVGKGGGSQGPHEVLSPRPQVPAPDAVARPATRAPCTLVPATAPATGQQ